jgi:hypothetical protein
MIFLNLPGRARARQLPEGKAHRVDPDFGSTLPASNRDSQPNCWVNWKIMGQHSEFQLPARRGAWARAGRERFRPQDVSQWFHGWKVFDLVSAAFCRNTAKNGIILRGSLTGAKWSHAADPEQKQPAAARPTCPCWPGARHTVRLEIPTPLQRAWMEHSNRSRRGRGGHTKYFLYGAPKNHDRYGLSIFCMAKH